MPPPTRKRKEPRDAQSVYPPRSVGPTLGGYRSSPMTQAVRCWAKLLEQASVKVGGQLTPSEWAFLASACAGREHEFSPDWENPGDHLAQLVERALHYEIGLDLLYANAKTAKNLAQRLADKVRGLDYLHAWATIWAIQWKNDLGDEVKTGEEWWTLGHRQKHAGG